MTFLIPPPKGLRRCGAAFWAALSLGLVLAVSLPATAQTQLSTKLEAPSASIPPTGQRAAEAVPIKTVAATAPPTAANPYGLSALWLQGDWVAKSCLLLLALMSVASWYALLARVLALRKLKKQTRQVQGVFKDVRLFAAHMAKLTADNPVRYVADAGSVAVHQYAALKPRVDYDTWLIRAIEQALNTLQTRMQGGMALLATVGSTAPFVGLFGTVWAIYTALVKIGASGQASIDRVAGPVGEALIMTAIGLAVAVPAVFGYNWLLRQNKLAFEGVRSFGAQLHSLLLATTDLTTPAAAPEPQMDVELGPEVDADADLDVSAITPVKAL
jgi:biopolymer transport protein ExbB